MELYVYLYVCVYVYVEGIYGSNNCSMDMHVCSCLHVIYATYRGETKCLHMYIGEIRACICLAILAAPPSFSVLLETVLQS